MKRSWLNSVAGFAFVAFGAVCGTAVAGHGGGGMGGGGFHGGGMPQVARAPSFSPVRQASFNGPISSNISPVKVGKPIGGGLSPTGGTKLPPVVTTPPVGPIGPIKPPGGKLPPVVTTPPVGPIGPIKPPPGKLPPVVTTPPVGPIGPIKPPPVGPGNPPSGGGGGQPPSGGTGTGHCHPCWPPIVLGCLPYSGGYFGGYYPPVYSSTVVVPAVTPVIVADTTPAAPPAPAATTAVATADVPAADKLPQVPVGATLTLQAKDLGPANGQVLLVMDKVTLGVQVNEWNNDYATATLPLVGITGLTKSEIVLVRADGHPASSVQVDLVPAQPQAGG